MPFPPRSVEEVLATRPLVRVNQVGYLGGRSKRATLVSDEGGPLPFTLRDPRGALWAGLALPGHVRCLGRLV